jgi:hypothetical protein
MSTTTASDILEMIEKLRHDESLSAREALSALSTDLQKRFDDGYLGVQYRTDYVVEGEEDFPFDMLRYTQSWPTKEEEIRFVERPLDGYPKRRVTLSKFHRDPKPNLAEDRWERKFGWKVVEILGTVAD